MLMKVLPNALIRVNSKIFSNYLHRDHLAITQCWRKSPRPNFLTLHQVCNTAEDCNDKLVYRKHFFAPTKVNGTSGLTNFRGIFLASTLNLSCTLRNLNG